MKVGDELLHGESWWRAVPRHSLEELVNSLFAYELRLLPARAASSPPVFVDTRNLTWVVIPGGAGVIGLSASEAKAARAILDPPFLTLSEMSPTRRFRQRAFLMTEFPLTTSLVSSLGGRCNGEIDAKTCRLALTSRSQATSLARKLHASLPSEQEWEHACRGGTKSLFWFGDRLPPERELEAIIGLGRRQTANPYGLKCLFFGEWCEDLWTPSHAANPERSKGWVVKGGAGRFWPWQFEGEWAGCVSAYRMPSRDTGGAGVAVRLIRRQIKGSECSDR
jgi:formylglycine-generating enzyme required for sulfatase activity